MTNRTIHRAIPSRAVTGRRLRPARLLGSAAIAALVVALAAGSAQAQDVVQTPLPADGPQNFLIGGGPAFGNERREIVAQFDANGDGWLNAEERVAAREFIAANPQQGGGAGGPGGGLFRGAPPVGLEGGPALVIRRPDGGGPGFAPPGGGRIGGGPGGGATETGSPGVTLTPADVEDIAGTPLYDTSAIRTIFIDFGFAGWEEELEDFYNTDVEIPVTATVDGVAYADVGVRFRGNSSFAMTPAGLKRPIRLKFDFLIDGQNVEGYRTLNLLNGVGDPTFTRTVLYSYIANKYIAAPKVNFVRLVVNGENWGVYANQQHFNRGFVEDYYGFGGDGVRWQVPGSPNARGGMEYLGDDIEQYRALYEIDNQDNDESWNALIDLFQVLNETPVEDLPAAIEPILDVDGVLRFLALEVALSNPDGYYARASDYYIYLDPSGVFHVAPHDMNEALRAGGGEGGVNLDPLVGLDDETKPLRSRLLQVPQYRALYLTYLQDIAANALDWDNLGPVAEGLHDLIDADMARDTRKLFSYEAFATGMADLRSFVEQRSAYLLSVVPALLAGLPAVAIPERTAAAAAPAAGVTPAEASVGLAYAQGEGPAEWTVAAGSGVVAASSEPGAPIAYFVFDALTDGFGDSKLDQCVSIDAAQPLSISYSVEAATGSANAAGLAVRVNPTFYADEAACLAAVAADDSDAALPGGRDDEDLDFVLGAADGSAWIARGQADDGALTYAAADIPPGAAVMRLSVRARDRSGLAPAPELRLGEISVTQADVELVRNQAFAP